MICPLFRRSQKCGPSKAASTQFWPPPTQSKPISQLALLDFSVRPTLVLHRIFRIRTETDECKPISPIWHFIHAHLGAYPLNFGLQRHQVTLKCTRLRTSPRQPHAVGWLAKRPSEIDFSIELGGCHPHQRSRLCRTGLDASSIALNEIQLDLCSIECTQAHRHTGI